MATKWRDLISHLFAGISPQDTPTPPPGAPIPLLYSPSNRSNSPPGGDQFEFCSLPECECPQQKIAESQNQANQHVGCSGLQIKQSLEPQAGKHDLKLQCTGSVIQGVSVSPRLSRLLPLSLCDSSKEMSLTPLKKIGFQAKARC